MSEPKHVPPPCRFTLDAERLVLQLDRVLSSDLDRLEEVVGSIIALVAQQGCRDDLAGLELAVHEALANAILHGNRSDPRKAVRVCLAVQQDCGLLIVVKDAGSGFDPATVPNPVSGDNLLRPHGRGIFLINQYMDDVRYRFDWGTTVQMKRHGRGNGAAPNVILYTLPGCRPCRRAKEFLQQKGVEFMERDVLNDEAAMAELLRLDYSRMPVIVVNGQAVTGFNPARLEQLLA